MPLDAVYAAVLELRQQEEQQGEAERAMDARVAEMTVAAKAMVLSPAFLFSPALPPEDWHLIAALSHSSVRQPLGAAAPGSDAGRLAQLRGYTFAEPEVLWQPEEVERPDWALRYPLPEIRARQSKLARRQAALQRAEAAANPAFQAVERAASRWAARDGVAADAEAGLAAVVGPAADEPAGAGAAAGAAAVVLGGNLAAAEAAPAAVVGPEAVVAGGGAPGAVVQAVAEAPAADALSPQVSGRA